MSKCKGGYGLKKQLDELDLVEPSLRKAKLQAMFTYPFSSNVDDQAALRRIHERLYSEAQSLNEKFDLFDRHKDRFYTIYDNPEVPFSNCWSYLCFTEDFNYGILKECIYKASEYVFEGKLQGYSWNYVPLVSADSKIENTDLTRLALKELYILNLKQLRIVSGLDIIVRKRKEACSLMDTESNPIHNTTILLLRSKEMTQGIF